MSRKKIKPIALVEARKRSRKIRHKIYKMQIQKQWANLTSSKEETKGIQEPADPPAKTTGSINESSQS